MNATDIASMLEPLREPAPVSWWPLAPGWWLLILVIFLALSYAVYYLWMRYQRGAPLREAKQRLESIREATELKPAERVAALGQLQRQIAIEWAGRDACAGLTGQAWAEFLNKLGKSQQPFFNTRLAELSYQTDISASDCTDAVTATENWLNSLAVSR